jgi:hypothetical protein
MSLKKVNFEINLAEGLDTKTDKKHLVPGKLTRLSDAVYTKHKRIDKRFGYDVLPNEDLNSNILGIGTDLSTFNEELLQYNSQRLYSYSHNIGKMIDKGPVVSTIITTKQIMNNTATQTQSDSAIINGIGVYAWEDSRGGVRCSVYDENSGMPLLADIVLDSSASYVRCLAFNEYLFVFYYKSGSLYVRRLNPIMPTAFDTAYLISSTVNTTNPTYDVMNIMDSRIAFAHNIQGSSAILLGFLNNSPFLIQSTTIAEAGTNSIGLVLGPSNTVYLFYQNSTNGVRGTITDIMGNSLHAPFTVESITSPAVVNITGYALSNGSGVQVFYEKFNSSTFLELVRTATVSTTGTISVAPADFMRSVGLISKAFTYTDMNGNSNSYVGVCHSSPLQSTYFVIRADGLIIGKQQYTNAGGLTSVPILSNVNMETYSIFSYSFLKTYKIVSQSGIIFTPTGVAKTKIDFTNENVFTCRQLGNNLLIVGGILNMYDGQSVVEHGFLLYPENNTVTAVAGGSLTNGTYGVVFVYEWTDAYGQIHRSQPSVPILVTTSGSNNSISVVAQSLSLTAKKGSRSPISIVGYVTLANGTIFYRFTSVTSPTFNDPTVDTIILPTITTNVLTSNEILYTAGGVLPNVPAPASSVIEVFQNRIWLGNLEDPDMIWFSKENQANFPVEFNDTFNKSIESYRGDVNAFGVLDDKILLIKRDKVYFTYGDGPNNTNTLGSFAEIVSTTIDIGTEAAKSVVAIPQGILLKTQKGYWGIDGTLTPYYIGDAVEDFNNLSVSSSVLLSDVNEARFTTSDGALLVYNYFFKRWSTFFNLQAFDSILYMNTYTLLRTNGQIFQENKSSFKDNAAGYGMSVETGWISVAGVTGYKRVYRLTFLGDYKSSHQLRISVAYDYSDAYLHSVTFNPDAALGPTQYGSDTPYGNSNNVYGGLANGYLVRVDMLIQKCTAIRFKIEEIVTSATSGSQEGLTISDLGLLIGLKYGSAKVPTLMTTAVS